MHSVRADDLAAAGLPLLAWLPMLRRVASVWGDYFERRYPSALDATAHVPASDRASPSCLQVKEPPLPRAIPTTAGLILACKPRSLRTLLSLRDQPGMLNGQ